MNNILKGWITSSLGIIILLFTILQFYGVVEISVPEGMTEKEALTISLIAGIAFFFIPSTKIEQIVEGFIRRKSEKQ